MVYNRNMNTFLRIALVLAVASGQQAFADVRVLRQFKSGGVVEQPHLRIRVGTNDSSGVDKVIFQVPGLQLGNGTPVVSTNLIDGASGAYTVRVVLDSRREPAGTARLTSDTSTPMSCISVSTCGNTTIPFNKISWSLRDGDNFDLASQFNGGNNQLLHQQTVGANSNPDPGNNSNPRTGWRYRDYVKFQYVNDAFLPAGTYRGRVLFKGTFP